MEEGLNVKEPTEFEKTEVPLRRSSRDRTGPKKLSDSNLGNPLVTVMHSILTGLDKAFSQTRTLSVMCFNCISLLSSRWQ